MPNLSFLVTQKRDAQCGPQNLWGSKSPEVAGDVGQTEYRAAWQDDGLCHGPPGGVWLAQSPWVFSGSY